MNVQKFINKVDKAIANPFLFSEEDAQTLLPKLKELIFLLDRVPANKYFVGQIVRAVGDENKIVDGEIVSMHFSVDEDMWFYEIDTNSSDNSWVEEKMVFFVDTNDYGIGTAVSYNGDTWLVAQVYDNYYHASIENLIDDIYTEEDIDGWMVPIYSRYERGYIPWVKLKNNTKTTYCCVTKLNPQVSRNG